MRKKGNARRSRSRPPTQSSYWDKRSEMPIMLSKRTLKSPLWTKERAKSPRLYLPVATNCIRVCNLILWTKAKRTTRPIKISIAHRRFRPQNGRIRTMQQGQKAWFSCNPICDICIRMAVKPKPSSLESHRCWCETFPNQFRCCWMKYILSVLLLLLLNWENVSKNIWAIERHQPTELEPSRISFSYNWISSI